MDADLLNRANGNRPVVLLPLAGAPGREYDTAAANGVRYFRDLGADAVAAPDARSDLAGALAALQGAGLIVLPGGSPARLLSALTSTPLGDALRGHHMAGGAVMGASAGAMVLCAHTVLPGAGARVVVGLGMLPGAMVVPHYTGHSPWDALAPAGVAVLGLPECSGVLVEGATLTAVGAHASTVAGRRLPLGDSVVLA